MGSLAFVPRAVGRPQIRTRKKLPLSNAHHAGVDDKRDASEHGRQKEDPQSGCWPSGCLLCCTLRIGCSWDGIDDGASPAIALERNTKSLCEQIVPRSCLYVQVAVNSAKGTSENQGTTAAAAAAAEAAAGIPRTPVPSFHTATVRCVSAKHARRLAHALPGRHMKLSGFPEAAMAVFSHAFVLGEEREVAYWHSLPERVQRRANGTAQTHARDRVSRKRQKRGHRR